MTLRITLALMFLLGVPQVAQAQVASKGPLPDESLLHFGPPSRWPESSGASELQCLPLSAGVKPQATSADPKQLPSGLYLAFALEFKDAGARQRFEAFKWPKISAFDRFLELLVAKEDRQTLEDQAKAFKDLVWMDQFLRDVSPPPPPAAPRLTRSLSRKSEAIVRGGHRGLTGKGVIVAIVDTGVDFRNPDFITVDKQGRPLSRLLYLWDTRSQAFDQGKGGTRPPLAYPNGASMGTLYTQAQLTAELRASRPVVDTTDADGHGTKCAGVAAGNGRNAPGRQEVLGVAPEADLIAVCGHSGLLLNAIVDWLDKVRGNRPLVLSHSMGGQWGGHDGMLVRERALSARFPAETKGRALVISAGNEGTRDSHAVLDLRPGAPGSLLAWKVPEGGTSLRLYVDAPSPDDLRIVNRNGQTVDTSRIAWSPYRGSGQILIQCPLKSDGQMLFSSAKGRRIRIDAYLGVSQGDENGAFTTAVTREALVGTPGTTDHAITVGAYIWNEHFDYQGKACTMPNACDGTPLRIGDIACYSSPGFSRSGEVKPDLAAPSDYFTASLAKTASGEGVGKPGFVDTSGNYVSFNGTSAATPYVAGVIALLFQKNPRLDLGTLRALLATHVTRDGFTGRTPNPNWGHGKLDLAAIDRLIDAVR